MKIYILTEVNGSYEFLKNWAFYTKEKAEEMKTYMLENDQTKDRIYYVDEVEIL